MNLSNAIALEHYINAAQGYLELGMTDEALSELDRVPPDQRMDEDAVQLRICILMQARQWERALEACDELRAAYPDSGLAYIHGAFCLHELGRTAEAVALLQDGPAALRREPIYFYNLGCYRAVLGDPDEAEKLLNTSFGMDEKFREIARQDPDLAGLAGKF